MKRGEVWSVSYDPSLGGEIGKTRPAVIVSNNASNNALNRIQVIPFTSNISKVYPCEALVTIKGKSSKACSDQIATVSKQRLKEKIGLLNEADMEAVELAIKLQLAI
jgi:mRNA interferase MazF